MCKGRLIKFSLLAGSLIFLLTSSSYAWINPGMSDFKEKTTWLEEPKEKSVEPKYVKNEALVKFKQEVSKDEIKSIVARYDCRITKYIEKIDVYKLKVPKDESLKKVIKALNKDKRVKYAEPNWLYKPMGTDGEELPDYYQAIQLQKALDYLRKLQGLGLIENIPVAVVDSGVMDHSDINLWVNPGEDLNGNGKIDPEEKDGIDNDGNGFVDDFYGWDFVDNDNDAQDSYAGVGHGTHVSGIVSTTGGNVAQIMRLRAGGRRLSADAIADSIRYAADNGAKVINLSLGGIAPSQTILDAIQYATKKGALVVGAAGNTPWLYYHFPASFWDVLSVAATTAEDYKTFFSSLNPAVDVSAPGYEILSSYFNNSYRYFSGTSMSTPVVSGIAALIFSLDKNLTPEEVKDLIIKSTDSIDEKNPEYEGLLGKGRVNAYKAIVSAHKYVGLKEIYEIIKEYNSVNRTKISDKEGDLVFYKQKIESILNQFPEESAFSDKEKEFLVASLEDPSYLGESGKIKWLLDLWQVSGKDNFLNTAIATNLEQLDSELVAENIKDRDVDEIIGLFEKLDEKYVAKVLSNLSPEITANYIDKLGTERNTIEILAYLSGISVSPILVPLVSEIMKEWNIPMEGINDPTGSIEVSENYINNLLENIEDENLKIALDVLYNLNKANISAEEAAQALKDLPAKMVANILEWVKPEKVSEIVKKFEPQFIAQLFKNSNRLFMFNITELKENTELMKEVFKNLSSDEIARLWLSYKFSPLKLMLGKWVMPNTSQDMALFTKILSPQKAAKVLNSIYKFVTEDPNFKNSRSKKARFLKDIGMLISFGEDNPASQERLDTIYKNLSKGLKPIWEAAKKITEIENLKVDKLPSDKYEKLVKEYSNILTKIEDPDAKLLYLYTSIVVGEDFFADVHKKIGKDDLINLTLKVDSPVIIANLLYSGETKLASEILSGVLDKFQDPYKQKAFLEELLHHTRTPEGDKLKELLSNLSDVKISQIASSIDRVTEFINFTKNLFEAKQGRLSSEIKQTIYQNNPEFTTIFDTFWTLLTKQKEKQEISDADIKNVNSLVKDWSIPVTATMVNNLESDMVINVLNGIYSIDKDNFDSLIDSFRKDLLVEIFQERDEKGEIKSEVLYPAFYYHLLKAEDNQTIAKFLSNIEDYSIWAEMIDNLRRIKQKMYGWDINKLEMSPGEVEDKISNIISELSKIAPQKAEAYEIAKLIQAKINYPEAKEELKISSLTSEEIEDIETLFKEIGPENSVEFLKGMKWWSSSARLKLSYKILTQIDRKIAKDILSSDTKFTAGIITADEKGIEILTIIDDPKRIAEVLNEIKYNTKIAEIYVYLENENPELAGKVKDELIKIREDEDIEFILDLASQIYNIVSKETFTSADFQEFEGLYNKYKDTDKKYEFFVLFQELISYEKFVQIITGIDKEVAPSILDDIHPWYLKDLFDPDNEETKNIGWDEKAEVISLMNNELAKDILFYLGFKLKEGEKDLGFIIESLQGLNKNMAIAINSIIRNSLKSSLSGDVEIRPVSQPTNFGKVEISDSDIKAFEEIYREGGAKLFFSILYYAIGRKGEEYGGTWFWIINPDAVMEIYSKLDKNILKELLTKHPEDVFMAVEIGKYTVKQGELLIDKVRYRKNLLSLTEILMNTNDSDTIAEFLNKIIKESNSENIKGTLARLISYMTIKNKEFADEVIQKLDDKDFFSKIASQVIELIELLGKEEPQVEKILAYQEKLGTDIFTDILTYQLSQNPKRFSKLLSNMDREEAVKIVEMLSDEFIVSLFDPENEIPVQEKIEIFKYMEDKRMVNILAEALPMIESKFENEVEYNQEIEKLKTALANIGEIKKDIFNLVKFMVDNSFSLSFTSPGGELSIGESMYLDTASNLSSEKTEQVGSKSEQEVKYTEEELEEIAISLENVYNQKGAEFVAYILNPENFDRDLSPGNLLAKLLLKIESQDIRKDILFASDTVLVKKLIQKLGLVKDENFDSIIKLFNSIDAKDIADLLGKVDPGRDKLIFIGVGLYKKDSEFGQKVLDNLSRGMNEDINMGIEFVEFLDTVGGSLETEEIDKIDDYTSSDKLGLGLATGLFIAYQNLSLQVNQEILMNANSDFTKKVMNEPDYAKFIFDSELEAEKIANVFLRKEEKMYIFNPKSIAEIYGEVFDAVIEEANLDEVIEDISRRLESGGISIDEAIQEVRDIPELDEIIGRIEDIHQMIEQTDPDFASQIIQNIEDPLLRVIFNPDAEIPEAEKPEGDKEEFFWNNSVPTTNSSTWPVFEPIPDFNNPSFSNFGGFIW